MSKFLKWLDEHILEYFSLALLIFIPLYPKIPLAEVLPGYLVRLRLDDILIASAFLVWVIWVIRGKISLRKNPLLIPIGIYILVGFLSTLSAMFITKTVPLETLHVAKLYLHFIRRIEYFSVFFVFFSSIKSLSQVKKYVYLAAIVLIFVSIYGFGQKYLYWPAYSTMNREFSKGVRLYLTEHARVLSTFGGHYDLAAYLMITLTLFIPLAFVVGKWFLKILFAAGSLLGFWLLILTVSRTSFLAYLVSITVVFAFLAFKKGWLWSLPRWFVIIFLSLFVMISFGDLAGRFAHVLKVDKFANSSLLKPLIKNVPSGPQTAYLDIVADKTDIPPTTQKPDETGIPADVYDGVGEEGLPASLSARPRVYSQAAVQYDLSTGIRLDYTWPQAIKGFSKNPVLGSGYSTLTKEHVEDFTDAESTDNDFLRALGETGLFGFLAFYGILAFVVWYAVKNFKAAKEPFAFATVAGLIGAIIGLLINAFYIDVFEASKVAYTFWIMVAILLATIRYSIASPKAKKSTR